MTTPTMDKTNGWCPAGVLPAELIFFLFKIGEALLEPSVRLYITEGVCLQMLTFHNESSTKCSHLSDYPDQEDDVQATSAAFTLSSLSSSSSHSLILPLRAP